MAEDEAGGRGGVWWGGSDDECVECGDEDGLKDEGECEEDDAGAGDSSSDTVGESAGQGEWHAEGSGGIVI